MKSDLTSILRTPSAKQQRATVSNEAKSRSITSFTESRVKNSSNKSGSIMNDSTSSLGKRQTAPTKGTASSKTSKTIHSNRYEPLSDDFQETTRSTEDNTQDSRDSPSSKQKQKPSSLKEAVRQVQKEQSRGSPNKATESPKKQDTNSPNEKATKIIKETEQNCITQDSHNSAEEETAPTHQDETMEDIHEEHLGNQTGSKSQDSNIHLNDNRNNPYTKKSDPNAEARRLAARQRKEQIYQEILAENQRENEEAKRAYKASRGAPDPNLEEQEQRKRPSVSFSFAKTDNTIELKDNQIRTFIHRFDLRIQIKPTDSEEECERLIQKQLHLFFSIVLQADETALIPPYLKLDRASKGFKDLSNKYQVADVKGFTNVKRYFSRLFPRPEGGQFYCNVILALTNGVGWLTESIRRTLQDNKMGLWKRPTDCEQVSEVGWLLYSTRMQDEERLSELLSKITKEEIGIRWRPVRTSTNFNRRKADQPPPDPNSIVRALHIECDSSKLHSVKYKIAKLYGSNVKTFPDGTKMRLIPPYQSVISAESKTKYGRVVARQAAFTTKLASSTTWEFSNNLLLDHKNKDSGLSLRMVLMSIPSQKFPGSPVFHSIDKTWGSDNGVTLTFIPENEEEGRMYQTGMIPYLRDAVGEWYLNAFTVEAIERHVDSIWDPETKQISSTTDAWVKNSLALDEEFNYTEFPNEEKPIIFDIPSFKHQSQQTPPIVRDFDSVSTFQTRASSAMSDLQSDEEMEDAAEEKKANQETNTVVSTNTPQLTVDTIHISNQEPEVSGLSDNDSRFSLLQSQINVITSNFTVALERLSAQASNQDINQKVMFENQRELSNLLKGIITQNNNLVPVIQSADNSTTAAGQPSSRTSQANHLMSEDTAGDPSRTAGTGS